MVPMANRPLMEHVIGLGTAGSVRNAMQQLDEPFLVISGDVLTDIDLGGRPAGPHGAAGLSRRPELLRPT
jgi:NDP-sugar pyrophosphorylase family protein